MLDGQNQARGEFGRRRAGHFAALESDGGAAALGDVKFWTHATVRAGQGKTGTRSRPPSS